jgi:hypothetical protein
MSEAFLGTWHCDFENYGRESRGIRVYANEETTEAHSRLAAAAPQMARALLLIEPEYTDRIHPLFDKELNAALTAAGFPDDASRDAARMRIHKATR